MEQKIKRYMISEIEDHVDPKTGEANITAMAEGAINALAGDNWEEWHDEYHPVWDIAVDVSDALGYGSG